MLGVLVGVLGWVTTGVTADLGQIPTQHVDTPAYSGGSPVQEEEPGRGAASNSHLPSPPDSVAALAGPARPNPVLAILAGIPEGSWVQVNHNRLQDVWTPKDHRLSYTHLGDNLAGIIGAWSSFAWDSTRGDLLLYGGGHANYGGNDVYRWRSASLLWQRAALPSQISPVPGILYGMPVDGADHAPASMHTYDNTLFLPLMDRFITFGGAAFGSGAGYLKQTAPNTFISTGPYLFDPTKADPNKVGGTTGSGVNPLTRGGQMWQNRDTYVTGQGDLKPTSFVAGMTASAVENGRDVVYVAGRANFSTTAHLYRYTIPSLSDPTQDTWERVGLSWTTVAAEGTGAYDPTARVFVRTGQQGIGPFVYWDLTQAGPWNRDAVIHPTDLSGRPLPSDIRGIEGIGMDFDPVRVQFLLWRGGAEVWALRRPSGAVTAHGWTVHREAAATLPGPGSVERTGGGVLGKWHYAPDLDAFVALQHPVDGEVWLYKPHGWRAPQPTGP